MQEDNKIEEYVNEYYPENVQKIGFFAKIEDFLEGRLFVPILLVFVAIIAFCLGRISFLNQNREPVRVINNSSSNTFFLQQEKGREQVGVGNDNSSNVLSSQSQTVNSEKIVASKNGSKYYFASCSGAKRISEKNKIFFNTTEDARSAGFTPATNCRGLK